MYMNIAFSDKLLYTLYYVEVRTRQRHSILPTCLSVSMSVTQSSIRLLKKLTAGKYDTGSARTSPTLDP